MRVLAFTMIALMRMYIAPASEAAVVKSPSSLRPPAGSTGALTALPEAPEKALVLNYCAICHDIDWVVRSGATVEGWTERIHRMIGAGATIPQSQIPAVAAYLAKAFPLRFRPESQK